MFIIVTITTLSETMSKSIKYKINDYCLISMQYWQDSLNYNLNSKNNHPLLVHLYVSIIIVANVQRH